MDLLVNRMHGMLTKTASGLREASIVRASSTYTDLISALVPPGVPADFAAYCAEQIIRDILSGPYAAELAELDPVNTYRYRLAYPNAFAYTVLGGDATLQLRPENFSGRSGRLSYYVTVTFPTNYTVAVNGRNTPFDVSSGSMVPIAIGGPLYLSVKAPSTSLSLSVKASVPFLRSMLEVDTDIPQKYKTAELLQLTFAERISRLALDALRSAG